MTVWGREAGRAQAFAEAAQRQTGLPVRALADAETAVTGAAIVCTATGAVDPVLQGRLGCARRARQSGGPSGPANAEIDAGLVAASRFIVDHREHVLAHGGEYLRAKAAGLADESAIAAEIGEVFAGTAPGRTAANQITVYKSLGHVVQDLAAVQLLCLGAGT